MKKKLRDCDIATIRKEFELFLKEKNVRRKYFYHNDNKEDRYNEFRTYPNIEDARNYINDAFDWADTLDGHTFWRGINNA